MVTCLTPPRTEPLPALADSSEGEALPDQGSKASNPSSILRVYLTEIIKEAVDEAEYKIRANTYGRDVTAKDNSTSVDCEDGGVLLRSEDDASYLSFTAANAESGPLDLANDANDEADAEDAGEDCYCGEFTQSDLSERGGDAFTPGEMAENSSSTGNEDDNNKIHLSTPRMFFYESTYCRPGSPIAETLSCISTDEYDWMSVVSESDREISKAKCPMGCESNHDAKCDVRTQLLSFHVGNFESPRSKAPVKPLWYDVDVKGEPGDGPRPPNQRSCMARTTDCQFARNGMTILHLPTQLPNPIADLVQSIFLEDSEVSSDRATKTLSSLGFVYGWDLAGLAIRTATHHGVRRFMERMLLASLALGADVESDVLCFDKRPRMVLRPDNIHTVSFEDRVRSPIPDRLCGYNYKPFVKRPLDLDWHSFASPSCSENGPSQHHRRWMLFKLKQDSGGEVIFPFLSFEYRGYDGDDGCGDNSAQFAQRRREAGCTCCKRTTATLGTAELECMATAAASVRIVERLNRRLRTKRKIEGQPVSDEEEVYLDDSSDIKGNVERAIRPNGQSFEACHDQGVGALCAISRLSGSDNSAPATASHEVSGITSSLSLRPKTAKFPRPVPAIAFSVAVSGVEAQIFVTWRRRSTRTGMERQTQLRAVVDDEGNMEHTQGESGEGEPNCPVHKKQRQYCTVKLATFALQDPEHHMKFRRRLESIFNWGAGPRLQQIKAVLDFF